MTELAGLRPVTDADGPALVDLIGAVYAEYPGCVLDLPGVDADLPRFASALDAVGGAGWVLPDGDALAACVGWASHDVDGEPGGELKRLYVAAAHRGRGLGSALVATVESTIAAAGGGVVELWSDSRFTDAHRLYERLGYTPTGESRHLGDPSDTTEHRFVRRLHAGPGAVR